MSYTVKKLADISGVSVRTLHYYDEIGLLKPAYHGDNNYRYYEEAQLLLLQQILFYRELGFPLSDIEQILNRDDFDKIKALTSHKHQLKGDLNRINNLIKTIDKTISHLKGKETMPLEDIFEGFTQEKQDLYHHFLVENGVSDTEINQLKDKMQHFSEKDWQANKRDGDDIHTQLALAIDENLSADSDKVQALIKKHYQMTTTFWTPTKASYIALGQFYGSNPDFVQFYHDIHPKLLAFLAEAMTVYAKQNLS